MLDFLKFGAKFTVLIPLIIVSIEFILSQTMGISIQVTEMPFGMQEPLEFFANGLATIVDTMPWFEVILDIMIWGVQLKLLFMAINLVKYVISLFLY